MGTLPSPSLSPPPLLCPPLPPALRSHPQSSRFRALQCLLSRPGYSRTTTALLISFAQKAAAAAWTSPTQPSPFKTRKVSRTID